MVIGDKRKFMSCCVTLKCKNNSNAAPGEYPFTNELTPAAQKALSEYIEKVDPTA